MFQCFHKRSPDLLELLRAAAKDHELPSLVSFHERQIKWMMESGLGPLFWFLSREGEKTRESRSWSDLKATYLTTRLISEIQLETLYSILGKCKGRLSPITLLKGSSTGSEFYPQPYLRVMRDLDLLVDPAEQPRLETILLQMGFRQQSSNSHEFYATHHHSMPFYHRENRVWVEVHRGLFPPSNPLARLPVFGASNISAELRPSSFKGIPVMRLSRELQIVYTASHWALELRREGGLFALLDIIYLLKKIPHPIRWETIFNWVEHSIAGTHLCLVLSYLSENNIVELDGSILAELFSRQKSFGRLNLKIAHSLITRYVAAGKIPLAPGKVAALWQSLLQDQGAACQSNILL
ncbi:MAG TPA: nucleotidyltransferase family protein [Candidatus Binatia bacterium]|jgi:hypothetical protein